MKPEHFSLNYIFIIILLIPVLFYATTLSMVNVWRINETFTHGFLIFPISLWLIWQNREKLRRLSPSPEPMVFLLLIPVLLLWFISHVVDIQSVQQLCMISMIPIITWLALGRKIVLSLLFPFMFLFFAVPLGQGLIPPMMDLTANFVVSLVKMIGVPIYQDGLYFILPTGNWNVVEECSGVRYLIASVALGTIYAYLSYHSNFKRLVFVVFAIIVPILANGLRAFGIVMIGHLSGMELATGVDHLIYGWVFFGIVIFAMFYIGSFWWDPVATADTQPEISNLKIQTSNKNTLAVVTLISIMSIITIKLIAYDITHNHKGLPEKLELSLPANFEDWQYDPNHSLNWQPEITSPDAKTSRVYRLGNDVVQIDIGYFLYQRPGAEAVTSQNRLTNPYGGDWKITHSSAIDEQDIFVKESAIRNSNYNLLIWQWFKVGSFESPNPYIAKIFEAYNQIFARRSDAAYISVATNLDENKDDSREKIREFLEAASKNISSHLDEMRE